MAANQEFFNSLSRVMRLFLIQPAGTPAFFSFSSITACSFQVRGEKQQIGTKALQKHKFKFTFPVWGETERGYITQDEYEFQSTLPVWGETRSRCRNRPR